MLVSIIIPCFNRLELLRGTLRSIRDQTHTNWECLLVDDGSFEEARLAMAEIAQEDNRIKFIERPQDRPKGANACRNHGRLISQGDFVVFFDSDDLMSPDYLTAQLETLQRSGGNYAICKSEWIHPNGKIDEGFRSELLESDNPIDHYISFTIFWHINAVIYKRAFLDMNELYFDESLHQSQEYDFHVKVLKKDKHYAVNEKRLVSVVASEESISFGASNALPKARSSIRVRRRFLKDPELELSKGTVFFLFRDMHRILYAQSMSSKKGVRWISMQYLMAHFDQFKLTRRFILPHFLNLLGLNLIFVNFGKGYRFLMGANQFPKVDS